MTRAMRRAYGPHPDEDSPRGVRLALVREDEESFWDAEMLTSEMEAELHWLDRIPEDPVVLERERLEAEQYEAQDRAERRYDDWLRGRGAFATIRYSGMEEMRVDE